MYDLRVLNQAWYIACDECVNEIDVRASNEEAFRYILGRCFRDAKELLEAAKEDIKDFEISGDWPRRDNPPW
jgi:hypothetical protein